MHFLLRLRSRTSVVDENLFGEPLKNRLMLARSRSMEAIAAAQEQAQQQQQQQHNNPDRLFVVRQQQHQGRGNRRVQPERPRTALATMRVGNR